jgi:hypothetical protein
MINTTNPSGKTGEAHSGSRVRVPIGSVMAHARLPVCTRISEVHSQNSRRFIPLKARERIDAGEDEAQDAC